MLDKLQKIHLTYPNTELAPLDIIEQVTDGLEWAGDTDTFYPFRFIERPILVCDWLHQVGWGYMLRSESWKRNHGDCRVVRLAKRHENPKNREFHRWVDLAHLDAAMFAARLQKEHPTAQFNVRDSEIDFMFENNHFAIFVFNGSYTNKRFVALNPERTIEMFSVKPTDYDKISLLVGKMVFTAGVI